MERTIDTNNYAQLRTKKQWKKYGIALFKILKRAKNEGSQKDMDILYDLCKPLVFSFVNKYWEWVKYQYDKQDFINDVNCIFLELVQRYKFKYTGVAYFLWYMKFMLNMEVRAKVQEILQQENDLTYMENYMDDDDCSFIFENDSDNRIYWNTFWKKVKKESRKFGRWGELFIDKYFLSDEKLKIKDINKHYGRNFYAIYYKMKKRLREVMTDFNPNVESMFTKEKADETK